MVRGMQAGTLRSGMAVTVGTTHGIGTTQAGTILGITDMAAGRGIGAAIGDGTDGIILGMVHITDGVA